MMQETWRPLREELERWASAGRRADFWLRDDDAIQPTAPLDVLLDLTGAHDIPVLLAVIPEPTGEPLAERLSAAGNASVAAHGWSHVNYAPWMEKKQELGPHRPHERMLKELTKGRARLEKLHGKRALPVLVPPWNRIDPALVPRLSEIGFEVVSTFGSETPGAVRSVNTTVDIIDWRGARGCRDHAALVNEIVAQLRALFQTPRGAIGVLTHHLVHDDAAWLFLRRLFEVTASNDGSCWRTMRELGGLR
ncbi:polysaccharide deacetylase family protein [Arvimicrobium flavum]|uniref:polysaccharide deacetylase family protein n=1 Tax=Arvimicrobium flavum TaxID=3393320 RepID=UPI00237B5740|nr:polysaccharide deacetylase family protein [Mesorhizobium shangrilense]